MAKSMGKINVHSAKAKGRRLQQWVCEQISNLLDIQWGTDCLIASREMGQSGTDVRLIGEALKQFPFSIECKYQETWSVPAFIQQAKENQKEDTDWLLFMKRNREKPVVVMDAEAFFKLMQGREKKITKFQLKSIVKRR
jgi:hypothetical protein